MLLYIIRHGQTEKNKKKSENEVSTDKNSKLDHIGKIQAINIGQYFYSLRNTCKLIAVYTSPRIRTLQTADLILTYAGKDIDIRTDDRLVKEANSNIIDALNELFISIYDKYKYTEGSILLVTHNHIIDTLYNKLETEDYSRVKVNNGTISCICINDKGNCKSLYWNKTIQLDFSLI